MKQFLICIIVCLITMTAQADTPKLAFPVDCTLGEDCWTVNYVDVNPAEDVHQDFKCNTKTYEAHKGTDFALRSRVEMRKGVDVLATMDGKVSRVRDGESDTIKTEEQYQAIRAANKDCGNGILIDHGAGKQSFYCHLKKDSITVKPDDEVKEGQVIAQIGQSGFSEFPHLHFAFIWEGGHMDPFTGFGMTDGCGQMKRNLWKKDIPYEPYAVFDGGFETTTPNFEQIKKGKTHAKSIKATNNTLVYWVGFYHARIGDEVNITLTDPDGQIFAQRNTVLKTNRKRPNFFYTGRKLSEGTLKPGTYIGKTVMKREGEIAKTFTHTINVE